MSLFHKIMLVILAMQLNVIIYFLGTIRQENDPVYRLQYLQEYFKKVRGDM